jgi:hypothetical protein
MRLSAVVISDGRALFRVRDLVELEQLVTRLRGSGAQGSPDDV